MRQTILILLTLSILGGVAHAEQGDRLRLPRSQTEAQTPRPRVPANPCAQFGPGFGKIEGSDTCVRIGGGVGISGGISGGGSGMTMPR